jgi:hypothetical protein
LVIEISVEVETVGIDLWVATYQKETGAIYFLLGMLRGCVFHLSVAPAPRRSTQLIRKPASVDDQPYRLQANMLVEART